MKIIAAALLLLFTATGCQMGDWRLGYSNPRGQFDCVGISGSAGNLLIRVLVDNEAESGLAGLVMDHIGNSGRGSFRLRIRLLAGQFSCGPVGNEIDLTVTGNELEAPSQLFVSDTGPVTVVATNLDGRNIYGPVTLMPGDTGIKFQKRVV